MRKTLIQRGAYKLVALAADAAELLIYGAIGKGWWSDTGVDALDVIRELQSLQASNITVRISSDGGSVTEGLAIHNALRRHSAKITTVVDSVAASIASVIFAAGDIRIMPSNTMLMLHGVMGDGGIGNAQQIRERADQIEQMSKVLVEAYLPAIGDAHRTEVETMLLDGKDHWLSAQDAQALDLCTQVDEALPLAAVRRVDLSRFNNVPAAAAVFKKEPAMNYKLIALALGLAVSATATDTDLRSAVLTHLNLAADADDKALEAALATRQAPPAPAAAVVPAAPAAAATAAQPTLRQRVDGMFAAALSGQADNPQLLALRRQTMVNLEAGREPNIEDLRATIITHAQVASQSIGGRHTVVELGDDQRDKHRVAAVSWLLTRAAIFKSGTTQASALAAAMQGNPYRGYTMQDLARACLEDIGVNTRGMTREQVFAAAITSSTSDFPNIFENALHKTLLAGFTVIPTSWDKLCKISSLSDFRPHIRYRSSSLGDLQVVGEDGEYKTLALSDAERESIQAKSRGGILNVSREMLINDDMSVFSDLAMEMGKSASRTREKAFYALLALNAGAGPIMGDGNPLFHSSHGNISANAGAPSVDTIDKDRQQMASQQDPSKNDYIDVRPSIWLGPLSLGGNVRVLNGSEYDTDTAGKYQKPNKVRGLYSQVLDTPRLSGAPWYSFADPNIEPVIEMGFLNGQQEPQIATEDAFTQNGMRWRIADEWGMGGIGWRGAVKNAGA